MSKVEFHAVKSSNISYVGYDKEASKLYVIFGSFLKESFDDESKQGTKIYFYSDVKEDTFLAMKSSPSVGKFFHSNVKNVSPYGATTLKEVKESGEVLLG